MSLKESVFNVNWGCFHTFAIFGVLLGFVNRSSSEIDPNARKTPS